MYSTLRCHRNSPSVKSYMPILSTLKDAGRSPDSTANWMKPKDPQPEELQEAVQDKGELEQHCMAPQRVKCICNRLADLRHSENSMAVRPGSTPIDKRTISYGIMLPCLQHEHPTISRSGADGDRELLQLKASWQFPGVWSAVCYN